MCRKVKVWIGSTRRNPVGAIFSNEDSPGQVKFHRSRIVPVGVHILSNEDSPGRCYETVPTGFGFGIPTGCASDSRVVPTGIFCVSTGRVKIQAMNPPYLYACVSRIFCGIVGSNLASTSEKVVIGSTYERKEGGVPPKQGDYNTDRLSLL